NSVTMLPESGGRDMAPGRRSFADPGVPPSLSGFRSALRPIQASRIGVLAGWGTMLTKPSLDVPVRPTGPIIFSISVSVVSDPAAHGDYWCSSATKRLTQGNGAGYEVGQSHLKIISFVWTVRHADKARSPQLPGTATPALNHDCVIAITVVLP